MLMLQVVLILLNAFFAGAEIALISVNENKMVRLAEEGNKKAARLVKMNKEPSRFLATIQVAITLSGFLASAFAADNFASPIVTWLTGLGVTIPTSVLHSIVVILITLVLSYFTLVFGELVPKQVAMHRSEELSLKIAGTINALSKIFKPLVSALTFSTNIILKLMNIDSGAEEDDVSEEEIRLMVDIGNEKGTIAKEEHEVIQNIFDFDDLTAEDLATHRSDVVWLDINDSVEEWNDIIFSTRHTLYPVCDGSTDEVRGILNIKDYYPLKERKADLGIEDINEILYPAYFVPDSIKANDVFSEMKRLHHVMAVVLDEYGGMTGILTMNDLAEEIVGELVNDTVEDDLPPIEEIGNNKWKVNGNIHVDDIERLTDLKLDAEEYSTINGLIYHKVGRIPKDGETFEIRIENIILDVRAVKNHKVETVIITKELKEEEQEP